MRAAYLLRGCWDGHTFQIAENDGSAVFVRQPFQFLVEQFLQVPVVVSGHSHFLHARFLFFLVSQFSHGSCLQCCLTGRSIEPVAHQTAPSQSCRLAHQHEKGGLEAVFNVGLVVEDTSANTQNHRPVPPNQGFKGVFVSLADEKLQ